MNFRRLAAQLAQRLCALLFGGLTLFTGPAFAADLSPLITDRLAVERVYYNHRTGTKPPFETALPAATVEKLVTFDLKKEAVLKRVYGVEITAAMIETEAARINASSKAPETLAEIKSALGNDDARFARAVIRPIIVERLLHDRFDNDDAVHAPRRRALEKVRADLLAARTAGANAGSLAARLKAAVPKTAETAWELTPRPAEAAKPSTPDELEIKKRFGPDAKIVSPSAAPRDPKRYFEDMPASLRNVLAAQLRQTGDVSAVIELPTGFLLLVATEVTAEHLKVAAANEPKRSYEGWLHEQP